jgi:aldose 1-epimerase
MLTLTSDASSVVVAPEYGAGLIGWMLGDTPMLRRALPQAAVEGNPHAMGCFPLLPYGNRIRQGQFYWRGRNYCLKRNFGDHPHAIHGLAWQRPWTVEQISAGSVLLSLDHHPDNAWPFAFNAVIGYSLFGSALTVTIEMTNRDATPTPAGLGVHPYFPKTNDPCLRFNSVGAWENGCDSLPSRHGPLRDDWGHSDPRPVAPSMLDNCFTAWDGTADILAGQASLRIEASAVFRQLQVFTPTWADFFCVEPISHVPDAVNRSDLPIDQAMHILEPNETLSGTVRFTPVG